MNEVKPTLSKVMHLKHDTKESFESYCNKVLSVNKSEKHESSLFENIFKTNQFACKLCDKVFSKRHHLKTHRRIHSYSCKVCRRTFFLKCNLERHETIHTGERTYFCDICMEAFLEKQHLVEHMQTHSGLEPCVCKVCNKSFSCRSNLNKHIKKDHS